MIPGKAILSTAYFPSIRYISKFIAFQKVLIESKENFSKQTYRNRCIILGANGPLTLTVPVKKEVSLKIPIEGARIDYDTPWNNIHRKAIESAYRCSPFYEFYAEDFLPFFTKKYLYLLELNLAILDKALLRIGISKGYTQSSEYFLNFSDAMDYREAIHPKAGRDQPDFLFNPSPYRQVFSEKFGFVANLSILDLLFNEGPNSLSVIKNHITSPE